MKKGKYQLIESSKNPLIKIYSNFKTKFAGKINGHELIHASWKVTVLDENKNVKDVKKYKAQSYVKGMLDLMYVNMWGVDTNITDILNVAQLFDVSDSINRDKTIVSHTPQLTHFGDDAGTEVGIVVGTSSVAVTIDDHKLTTQITTNMGHGTQSITQIPTTTGTKRSFKTSRAITNNTGASVTIREIGIYLKGNGNTNILKSFCIEHSVIADTILLAADSVLVEYEIKIDTV